MRGRNGHPDRVIMTGAICNPRPHHTEHSRSGLLAPYLASQWKCEARHLGSDCSKLSRRPGPPQNGPSIEKPLLRAGLEQGGQSATRESGSGPQLSSLSRRKGVGRAFRLKIKSPARPVPRHLQVAICCPLGRLPPKQARPRGS